MKVSVGSIVVRERVRKDFGDIDSLAASMRDHGQLNPISLTRNSELIAGHRRLMAARKLGWQFIDACIVERDSETDRLELELEENVHRKDFSPEELLEGYRRLEKLHKPTVGKRFRSFFKKLFARLLRRRTKEDGNDVATLDAAASPQRDAAHAAPNQAPINEAKAMAYDTDSYGV